MASANKKHIHKYHRLEISQGVRVWACGWPTCHHYMPKHMERLVEGKASYCWQCDEQFTLEPRLMNRDKPICDDCINPQPEKSYAERLLDDAVAKLGDIQ